MRAEVHRHAEIDGVDDAATARLRLGLQHDHRPAGGGQLSRGGNAGSPRADDDDVHLGRRLSRALRQRRRGGEGGGGGEQAAPGHQRSVHRAWRIPIIDPPYTMHSTASGRFGCRHVNRLSTRCDPHSRHKKRTSLGRDHHGRPHSRRPRRGRLAAILDKRSPGYEPTTPSDPTALAVTLRPGDILLVEGDTRISAVIKYLTQSTWSHAAMYVGPIAGRTEPDGEPHVLVEAYLGEGVISAPLSKYRDFHTRICRPVGLTEEDQCRACGFMIERIGLDYDLKNILDMLRFLIPLPIPVRWRRRMIAFGSVIRRERSARR